MKNPKVKDIIDVIQAINIKVVEFHHPIKKTTEKITLYLYEWDDEIGDFIEKIYDENFQQRLVKAIIPIDAQEIEIRVFNEE